MKISKKCFSVLLVLILLFANTYLFASLNTGSSRIIGKTVVSLESVFNSSSSKSVIKPATLNKVRGDFS